MFVLTNLITNSTKSQFHQSLLNKDILLLIIQVLDCYKDYTMRLVSNILESLERFFKYERELNDTDELTIRDFFEASGGVEGLVIL